MERKKRKLYLLELFYFIYLYSSIGFSNIYFTANSQNLSLLFNVFNISMGFFLSFGALYYIYRDFKQTKYLKSNNNSKLFLTFFIACILASIINGNGFQKFNNIYFVIHSALFFFLVLQNNYLKKDYIQLLNFIIVIIVSAIFIISMITIFMFICNKIDLTKTIQSQNIQNMFYLYAPTKGRWNTILSNSNTFGHLVSMTFFLSFMPLNNFKSLKYKIIYIFMQLINLITLFFSGSKGAILSVIIGIVLSSVICLIISLKDNKEKNFFKIVIGVLSFLFILFITGYIINEEKFMSIMHYFNNDIFRLNTIKNGTGRFGIWESLLDLPLLARPFGYSDKSIYQYMKSLNMYDFDVFLNNNGRAHNMYLQALVSFGSVGFILFILCLTKTIIQALKNWEKIRIKFKRIFIIFFIQFVVILAGGMTEQLPIFNLSPHSLIFMLVWANLLTLSKN